MGEGHRAEGVIYLTEVLWSSSAVLGLGWDTVVLVKDQTPSTISPGLRYPLKETLQVCPITTPTLHRHFPLLLHGRGWGVAGWGVAAASLCLQTAQQPKVELITSLPLANQNPKGLIKIPLVAKPWVRSDFISEISEPDWKMPKQSTCLNMKQTSQRPFFSHERARNVSGGLTQTSRGNIQPRPPRGGELGSEIPPPAPAPAPTPANGAPTPGAAAGIQCT